MPPLTVASFATITHSRPSTTPIPVTMPAPGRLSVVHLPGRERRQLEERRVRVAEPVDPLACGQLPASAVALERRVAAAAARRAAVRSLQLLDERRHPLVAARERVRAALHLGAEHGPSAVSLARSPERDADRVVARREGDGAIVSTRLCVRLPPGVEVSEAEQ